MEIYVERVTIFWYYENWVNLHSFNLGEGGEANVPENLGTGDHWMEGYLTVSNGLKPFETQTFENVYNQTKMNVCKPNQYEPSQFKRLEMFISKRFETVWNPNIWKRLQPNQNERLQTKKKGTKPIQTIRNVFIQTVWNCMKSIRLKTFATKPKWTFANQTKMNQTNSKV